MGKASSFTPTIDLLLKGAKRRVCACSRPVKKAPTLFPVQLASVLAKIYPPDDHVGLACPVRLRTAFQALFIYHLCFAKLQAKHFESVGDDVMVTFPSSKNDQMHRGHQSCLAAMNSPLCPFRITKLYFRRFGLCMGVDQNDESFPASGFGVSLAASYPSGILFSVIHRQLKTGDACSPFVVIRFPRRQTIRPK